MRRNHLPWAGAGSGSGHCDARIGRFCYWHGDAPERAPGEAPATVRARAALLAVLDTAALVASADGWIAGQRVRYRLEAGQPDSAIAAVTPCAATPWWCDALRGLAFHVAGRFASAASAFDAALAEMPADERCRWTDLSALLDGRLADRYSRAGCDDRAALNARLWWLAQPFYSMDANDRRTEHFARLTMIRIAENSVWPEVGAWGDDLRELMLRYGWPRWFERVRPEVMSDPSYAIMGHDPQPSFAFFPDARLLDSAYAARPDDWNLQAFTAASRYAPAYVQTLEPARVALSRFRRGDSELVAAAYDVSGDSVLGRGRVRVALAVTPDERQRFVGRRDSAGGSGGVAAAAPATPALASLELFDDSARAAARVRQGVVPLPRSPGLALSDILLFRPSGNPPRSLAEALPTAVPDATNADRGTIGLYWELYGALATGTALDVSLTIERTGVSWWQRARWALHLGGKDAPVSLRWRDVARPGDGVIPQTVAVDLSRLDGGTYLVRIAVGAGDLGAVSVERPLNLRR